METDYSNYYTNHGNHGFVLKIGGGIFEKTFNFSDYREPLH